MQSPCLYHCVQACEGVHCCYSWWLLHACTDTASNRCSIYTRLLMCMHSRCSTTGICHSLNTPAACCVPQVSWSPGLSDVLQQVEAKFAHLKQSGSSREDFIKLVRSQVLTTPQQQLCLLSQQSVCGIGPACMRTAGAAWGQVPAVPVPPAAQHCTAGLTERQKKLAARCILVLVRPAGQIAVL